MRSLLLLQAQFKQLPRTCARSSLSVAQSTCCPPAWASRRAVGPCGSASATTWPSGRCRLKSPMPTSRSPRRPWRAVRACVLLRQGIVVEDVGSLSLLEGLRCLNSSGCEAVWSCGMLGGSCWRKGADTARPWRGGARRPFHNWFLLLCGREGKCCGKASWMKAMCFACLQSGA